MSAIGLKTVEITGISVDAIVCGYQIELDCFEKEYPLVGSFSRGLFLVGSANNKDSDTRNFNVGALSSYIAVLKDEKIGTKYIDELKEKDEILLTNYKGVVTQKPIIKIKKEETTMFLIKAKTDRDLLHVWLPDSDSVLIKDTGEQLPVTENIIGENILFYSNPEGTHFGMRVDGPLIIEK